MRIVLDTNVVVSALLWGGTPLRLLELAVTGSLELYTSPTLVAELDTVLHRDHLARRLIDKQIAIEEAVGLYQDLCITVSPLAKPRVVPNDIDDDEVIACALASSATLIVTGDSDLLVLHPWKQIDILNAADAVTYLQSANH